MLNWDIKSLNLMHEEMIKKAEKEHQAQEAIDENRKGNPHYNPTLAWFGRRMVNFGGRLVEMSGSENDKQEVYSPHIHLN